MYCLIPTHAELGRGIALKLSKAELLLLKVPISSIRSPEGMGACLKKRKILPGFEVFSQVLDLTCIIYCVVGGPSHTDHPAEASTSRADRSHHCWYCLSETDL